MPSPGMEPVGLCDEFLVIRTVLSELRQLRPQLSVLLVVPFQRFLVQLQHRSDPPIACSRRPVEEGLNRVVRTVQRPPSRRVQQVSALVDVLCREAFGSLRIRLQQLPFEQRPRRSGHRSIDHDGRIGGVNLRRHCHKGNDSDSNGHSRIHFERGTAFFLIISFKPRSVPGRCSGNLQRTSHPYFFPSTASCSSTTCFTYSRFAVASSLPSIGSRRFCFARRARNAAPFSPAGP